MRTHFTDDLTGTVTVIEEERVFLKININGHHVSLPVPKQKIIYGNNRINEGDTIELHLTGIFRPADKKNSARKIVCV